MAKDEVKIRFAADTKEFNDGIKNMNSDIAGLRSELRLNSTQLKLSANDTSLLKDRQKLLSDELEKSQSKVELTNSKLQKAKEIYGEDAQVVKKYERALIDAKNQEAAIQNELSKTTQELIKQQNSLDDVADKMGKFGEGAEAAGEKMMVVSGGIAAVAGASVSAFNELDAGYDTIITKTGATGDALEDLQGSMDNVFTELPTEAETAGIAIGEVNTRFKATGEELENLSSEFIRFSEINNTDLNSSIDNTDAIMTKFNVDASQTSEVLGLMTKAGQDTGLSMDTLQNTLTTNGATMKELGLDIVGSVNLLAQFEENGVDASTAMMGLKKAQQNATAEGKTLKDALGETITSIQNAETQTEALQIATDLFGKKGAAEMTQAIREGRFSVDDLSGSLSEYSGVVESTFNATLDPPDQMKIALNELKTAGSDLGGELLTTLTPAVETVCDKVEAAASWFSDLNSEQQSTVIAAAGVVAATGPALIVIGKVAQGVSTMTKAVGAAKTAWATYTAGKAAATAATTASSVATTASTVATTGATVAQTGLNTAILACPITWIVLAIVGLVAAFVVLWNKCEGFRNFWIGLWEKIKSAATTISEGVKGVIGGISDGFSKLKEGASKYVGSIKDTFTEHGGGIKGAAAVYMKLMTERFRIGYDVLNKLTGGKLDEVKNKAVEKFQDIKDKAGENLGKLQDLAGQRLNGIKDTFNKNGGGIKGAAAVYMELMTTPFRTGYAVLNKLTGGKLDEMKNTAVGKLKKLQDGFKNGVEKIKQIFTFKLEIPKIKMPSIVVSFDSSGALAKAAQLLGFSGMPKFDIKWNKEGAIFTKPTIAGFANGMWQGVGEAGYEAVLPIEKLEDMIWNKMSQFVQMIPVIDYERLGEAVAEANARRKVVIEINKRELGRVKTT